MTTTALPLKGENSNIIEKAGIPSITSRFFFGSVWVICGHMTSQAIRLASNLILTRLLFPEAFGLMALVNIFLQGLEMFTVLGIGPSIIQNKRGDDPSFLNTAWTIQVIRGFGLWILTLALAWPVAEFYNQKELLLFIPVAGFTTIISGFNPTSLHLQNRNLELKKITLIEFFSQGAGVVFMILWAWLHPTIWALVFGRWFSCIIKMALSHIILKEHRNRFQWEGETIKEIIRFGKWIFLGTALSFLATQGDRLILGKYLSMTDLGIYSIAYYLSHALIQILQNLASKMLFPVYSIIIRDNNESLLEKTKKIRLTLMLITLPVICATVIWGNEIVRLLYDERYYEAGWMLRILGIGAVIESINVAIGPILLAAGDSYRHMIVNSLKTAFLFFAMIAGGYFWGTQGLIMGIPVSYLLTYPVIVCAVKKYGAWTPVMDISGLLFSMVVIFYGYFIF